MYCSRCGTNNDDSSKYCGSCGNILSGENFKYTSLGETQDYNMEELLVHKAVYKSDGTIFGDFAKCWKTISFRGRARRREYWYFSLAQFFIVFGGIISIAMVSLISRNLLYGGVVLLGLYLFASIIPGYAVTVRRLHDIDKSASWVLISMIPYIGGFILLFFAIQDGTIGKNRFGTNPKE